MTATFKIPLIAEFILYKFYRMYPLPDFVIDPPDCGASYNIKINYIKNGVVTPLPNFISLDTTTNPGKPHIKINLDDSSCVLGVFEFEFVGTVDSTTTVTGGLM